MSVERVPSHEMYGCERYDCERHLGVNHLVVQGVPLQPIPLQIIHAVLELPPSQRICLDGLTILKDLPSGERG